MVFEYKCKTCGKIVERIFPIGKAKASVKCDCGKMAKRAYTSMSFQLKGGGWPSKTARLNTEMTQRNEEAGKRMRKEHTPMAPVAYDYGNGDVREAKKE